MQDFLFCIRWLCSMMDKKDCRKMWNVVDSHGGSWPSVWFCLSTIKSLKVQVRMNAWCWRRFWYWQWLWDYSASEVVSFCVFIGKQKLLMGRACRSCIDMLFQDFGSKWSLSAVAEKAAHCQGFEKRLESWSHQGHSWAKGKCSLWWDDLGNHIPKV